MNLIFVLLVKFGLNRSAIAQLTLGNMYAQGEGVVQSHQEAVKWFRKAAEQGQVLAQFKLGVAYESGTGLAQSYQETAKWYRKAADQGYILAQLHLGTLYLQGKGVAQDKVRAYMWFNLAAAHKFTVAIKARDHLGQQMTTSQLAQAKVLTNTWRPHYPEPRQ